MIGGGVDDGEACKFQGVFTCISQLLWGAPKSGKVWQVLFGAAVGMPQAVVLATVEAHTLGCVSGTVAAPPDVHVYIYPSDSGYFDVMFDL